MEKIIELFDKPKIIGVVASVNQGKSNLIYHMITSLKNYAHVNLFAYGLRNKIKGVTVIDSVEEMEELENSILVIDEMMSLFNLENRKSKKEIENTLRLINHHNNIIVLVGLGENFKKFLSAKLDVIIYKKVYFADLINGSVVKDKITNGYHGLIKGSTQLNVKIGEALVYNGLRWRIIDVPYMSEYDSKLKNVPILVPKNKPQK